jgi:hypothetical protein
MSTSIRHEKEPGEIIEKRVPAIQREWKQKRCMMEFDCADMLMCPYQHNDHEMNYFRHKHNKRSRSSKPVDTYIPSKRRTIDPVSERHDARIDVKKSSNDKLSQSISSTPVSTKPDKPISAVSVISSPPPSIRPQAQAPTVPQPVYEQALGRLSTGIATLISSKIQERDAAWRQMIAAANTEEFGKHVVQTGSDEKLPIQYNAVNVNQMTCLNNRLVYEMRRSNFYRALLAITVERTFSSSMCAIAGEVLQLKKIPANLKMDSCFRVDDPTHDKIHCIHVHDKDEFELWKRVHTYVKSYESMV